LNVCIRGTLNHQSPVNYIILSDIIIVSSLHIILSYLYDLFTIFFLCYLLCFLLRFLNFNQAILSIILDWSYSCWHNFFLCISASQLSSVPVPFVDLTFFKLKYLRELSNFVFWPFWILLKLTFEEGQLIVWFNIASNIIPVLARQFLLYRMWFHVLECFVLIFVHSLSYFKSFCYQGFKFSIPGKTNVRSRRKFLYHSIIVIIPRNSYIYLNIIFSFLI
jgi:hypothetical protein